MRLLLRLLPVAGCCALGPALVAAPAGAVATVCPSPAIDLVNGGFEEPTVGGNFAIVDAGGVPGWETTAGDNRIELWRSGYNDVPAVDGGQLAELNANVASTLFQTLPTTPGGEMTYRVHHRGRSGVDVGRIEFGPPGGPVNHTVTMSDGTDAWGTYVGTYVVPPGQTATTFGFTAVSTASGTVSNGNLLDAISFGTTGCVTVTKSVVDVAGAPVDAVRVGDVLAYTVEVANPGGAPVAGPRVADTLPSGLAYVPGSFVMLDGSRPGPRTDADDGDGVTVVGNQIDADVSTGGPPSIPAGASARMTFRAAVLPEAAGRQLGNVVTVDYLEPRLSAPRVAVSADAVVRVLAAPDPVPVPDPVPSSDAAGPTLPATGPDVLAPALVAVLCLAGGAALVRVARKAR